jgi:ribonuclease III
MMSTATAPSPIDVLEDCQTVLHYRFQNPDLLRSALTHASGANSRLTSNERLEFLGDAVLGLVVCEQLFAKYANLLEGEMTRIKSAVVSRRTCAALSQSLGLHRFLQIGKGMQTEVPANVLADVFEALIAAVYLDGGLDAAREFILRHLAREIDLVAESTHGENYKSQLQQLSQRESGAAPSYVLLDEKGPEHSKCFKISAVIGSTQYPAAWGRTKKEAEQKAALNALSHLQGEPIPCSGD